MHCYELSKLNYIDYIIIIFGEKKDNKANADFGINIILWNKIRWCSRMDIIQ